MKFKKIIQILRYINKHNLQCSFIRYLSDYQWIWQTTIIGDKRIYTGRGATLLNALNDNEYWKIIDRVDR